MILRRAEEVVSSWLSEEVEVDALPQEVVCGKGKGVYSKRSSRPAFHSRIENLAGFELIAAGVVVAEKKVCI